MRLLWIATVLALIRCNYGANESSTGSDTSIEELEELEELFNPNATIGNKSGSENDKAPNVSQELVITQKIPPQRI